MRRITQKIAASLAVLALVACVTITGFSQTLDKYKQDGKIYVKLKNSVAPLPMNEGNVKLESVSFLQDLIDQYQIKSIKNSFYPAKDSKLERTYLVSFNNISGVDQLISKLEKMNAIEYAESAPLFYSYLTPNDPDFATAAKNWHLKKIGAEAAWDISTGSAAIKVAVLDNGMYAEHPDLASKIVLKRDVADGDDITTPGAVSNVLNPSWSHGTHTSGAVAAATNNAVGIAAIGYDVSLIAVKVGRNTDGALIAGFEGITWAADNGADVISMSWGGPTSQQTGQNIVDYAYNKGCVLVAAAGNNGDGAEDANNVNYIGYPANYNHVIAVGSTGSGDVASSFSEYGTWIDVMAPGEAIWSTGYGSATGNYMNMDGTSMACPIVAGLCGLMLSVNPNLTPDLLTTYLKQSCTNIESLQNTAHQGMVGAGRINAAAALTLVQSHLADLTPNFTASATLIGVDGNVTFTDASIGTGITSWNWTFEGGNPATFSGQTPSVITYPAAGTYDVTLVISDGTNSFTETKADLITVQAAGGSSAWIQQNSSFAVASRGASQIVIVDANTAWSLASDGSTGAQVNEFTKTVDGGATWVPGVINIPATLDIGCITAVSAQKAWIAVFDSVTASTNDGIYATVDGGATWTKQTTALFSNTASFPNVVYFFNENDGFCMGDPINNEFEIYTTADGGTTWTVVDGANIPDMETNEMGWVNVYDAVGSTAWFGTSTGRVMKTTDKGLTWTAVKPTGFSAYGGINKICFNDELHGIIQRVEQQGAASNSQGDGSIVGFNMSKTEDGGATWTSLYTAVNTTNNMRYSDITAVPGQAGKYICVGTNGTAFTATTPMGSSISTNYGATWDTLDMGIQYICLDFFDNVTGWAGGFSQSASLGGIYKWANNPAVTIEDNNNLSNNTVVYPNPTNGSLNVSLLNVNSTVSIKVVNILGEVVYASTDNANGEFVKQIDLASYNKGLYIVIIESNNTTSNYKVILE